MRGRAQPAGQGGQLDGVAGRSLTPSIIAHSKLIRRPVASRYSLHAVDEGVERVAAVERHELVAQRVVGGVELTASVTGRWRPARRRMPGTTPTVDTRDVPGRQAEVVVDPLRPPPTPPPRWPAARPCP